MPPRKWGGGYAPSSPPAAARRVKASTPARLCGCTQPGPAPSCRGWPPGRANSGSAAESFAEHAQGCARGLPRGPRRLPALAAACGRATARCRNARMASGRLGDPPRLSLHRRQTSSRGWLLAARAAAACRRPTASPRACGAPPQPALFARPPLPPGTAHELCDGRSAAEAAAGGGCRAAAARCPAAAALAREVGEACDAVAWPLPLLPVRCPATSSAGTPPRSLKWPRRAGKRRRERRGRRGTSPRYVSIPSARRDRAVLR